MFAFFLTLNQVGTGGYGDIKDLYTQYNITLRNIEDNQVIAKNLGKWEVASNLVVFCNIKTITLFYKTMIVLNVTLLKFIYPNRFKNTIP